MPSPALAHALPGPLAIVVSVGASVFLSLRRRFRLLVAALPLHASVVVLAFVVQGYLRILSWPPLSFWILNRLYGA
jgi:multisubunit Na+/H+ antiporter MnhC subunit